jgi:hypothetical protein
VCGNRETASARECFGADQVRLLKFQPGQIGGFDRRVDGTAAVFAPVGAELAMQIGMPVDDAAVSVVSHVALLPDGLVGRHLARLVPDSP